MKKTLLEHMSQFEFGLLLKIKNSFGNYSTSLTIFYLSV